MAVRVRRRMSVKKPTKADNLLQRHKEEYEAVYAIAIDEATAHLYNRFVGFISESRIPLYNVSVVLDILKAEVTEQIRKKQGLI